MRRLQLVTLLALALLSAGCAAGADMRYRPAASQRAWGAKAPCFAPPVDFRFGVSAGQLVPGQDYASDWRDLSASLVEHAQAAGLAELVGLRARAMKPGDDGPAVADLGSAKYY